MREMPQLGDFIVNKNSGRIGEVISVNKTWGYYTLEFVNSTTKDYTTSQGNYHLVKLSKEERADYLLKLERLGITDYWSD